VRLSLASGMGERASGLCEWGAAREVGREWDEERRVWGL
jgi:hypothetical protein